MKRILPILAFLLAVTFGFSDPVNAGSKFERGHGNGFDQQRGAGQGNWRNGGGRREWSQRNWGQRNRGHQKWGHGNRGYRQRPGKNVILVQPYRHRYHAYGHSHGEHGVYGLFAFTALTLGVLDLINDSQQRAHEAAYIRATRVPVGETIQWHDGGASGAVTPTREGTSSAGRYCREFQQTVTIGGRTEQSYGTACMQPDGSWEIVAGRLGLSAFSRHAGLRRSGGGPRSRAGGAAGFRADGDALAGC